MENNTSTMLYCMYAHTNIWRHISIGMHETANEKKWIDELPLFFVCYRDFENYCLNLKRKRKSKVIGCSAILLFLPSSLTLWLDLYEIELFNIRFALLFQLQLCSYLFEIARWYNKEQSEIHSTLFSIQFHIMCVRVFVCGPEYRSMFLSTCAILSEFDLVWESFLPLIPFQ